MKGEFSLKINKRWLLGFILLFIFALAACGGEEDSSTTSDNAGEDAESSTDSESSDSSSSEEVIELAIGYSGPLSGPAAFYGESTLNGLEMAAEEINNDGGFEVDGQQYNINLVTLDDQYLPDEAAANAKRLVQEEDAKIIFNPHSGGIYAMQVFNEEDDFLIGAYTSEPGVIEQGNSLTWRIPPGYDIYIEPFTKHQMDNFGDKIALL